MTDFSNLKAAMPFELESLLDLVRWLVSSSHGQASTVFYFKHGEEHIYGALIILPGYYELNGLPTFVYSKHQEEPSSSFMRFDIREEAAEKGFTFVKGFDDRDSNLGYIQYIPIVKLKTPPPIFKL